MKKVYLTLLSSLLTAGGMMAQTDSKPLILTGPAEYYIKGFSQNGAWAYGTFVTVNNQGYGFRWNLRNNKIEMLSGGNVTNEPTGISNDGVLVGSYKDNTLVPNGAYVRTGGFWANGSWGRYPNPITGVDAVDKDIDVGGTLYINSISPDGHYMSGANDFSDIIVWKDGKLDWTSKTGYTCIPSCISSDGQMVAGWSYEPLNEDQRMPVLWKNGENPIWLACAPVSMLTSNQECYQFSSDNKWLLYWGSYHETGDPDKATLYAMYDVENNKTVEIPSMTDRVAGMRYVSISGKGTAIGYETGAFYSGKKDDKGNNVIAVSDSTYLTMYKDGKVENLYNYLVSRGVDFKSIKDFHNLVVNEGMSISDNECKFALRYQDSVGYVHPLVIMLDENITSRPPIQVEANRMVGMNGVLVTWLEPLANAEGVKSYNIYRNGQLLSNVPAGTLRYVDGTVQTGDKYEYTVKAVYAEGESDASDVASVECHAVLPQAPINLFTRQVRENNALLQWDAPKSNLTVKNYYDAEDDVTGFGANDLSFEVAINIPADEMAVYKGQKLTAVSFYPMTQQNRWLVNIYSKDPATGELQQLYSQPITQELNYGKSNVVVLDTPLDLPEDKDIYVGIAVYPREDNAGYNVIGEVSGKVTPGYSDLLRSIEFEDPDFFSAYENSKGQLGYSSDSWAIDAIFTPENADSKIDEVASYNVYVDGQQVGNANTNRYETAGLSQGKHKLGVAAVYSDGRVSPATETQLNVTENAVYYQPVSGVYAEPKGDNGITAHWNIQKDKDASYISYAYGDFQRSVASTKDTYYNYRARVEYSANMFKGYEGYKITAFRFYPCANADFTFILYSGDTVIAELPVESYNLYEWNDVPLPTPIDVQQGIQYNYEIDCYDTEDGGAPLAADNGVQVNNVSNLFSLDEGRTYRSMSTSNDISGNWMMGLKLEADEERPLNIAGFNVVIDNKKVNDELVQGESYDYVPARTDARSHRLRVDAVYNVKGEVQGSVVIFTFAAGGPEGINDATVAQISVDRNGSQIQVNGADVQSLTLVGMDGKTVASAAGNAIDVTHVQAGSYVLSAKLASGEVKSQKLMVK